MSAVETAEARVAIDLVVEAFKVRGNRATILYCVAASLPESKKVVKRYLDAVENELVVVKPHVVRWV